MYREKNIIYTDLKPENILINDEETSVVLTDMDMYVEIKDEYKGYDIELSGNYGTQEFRAPETIMHCVVSDKTISWQLGILLYAMFTLSILFDAQKFDSAFNYDSSYADENKHEIKKFKYKMKLNKKLEKFNEIYDLIEKLCEIDKNNRLSILNIHTQPFIKE
jgi:serine/threonine protein kinase